MEESWYKDGLCFSCTRCGNCCTGEPGFVWLNDQEISEIAAFLELSEEEFLRQHTRLVGTGVSLLERPNGDCVLYDRQGRGCTVYPVRPRQCRTWPFWQSNLASEATWEKTRQECPGAGTGAFFSAEEIAERAAVIRV